MNLDNNVDSQVDCRYMEDPTLQDWYTSPRVTQARRETGYDGTGDVVALLERLLEITEEPQSTDHVSPGVRGLLLSLQDNPDGKKQCVDPTGRPNMGTTYQIVLCLLDCGADPARIVEQGFAQSVVDWAVAKWHPWRQTAVTMAAQGSTADEIRDVIWEMRPNNRSWDTVAACLRTHGYDVGKPLPRRFTGRADREQIIALLCVDPPISNAEIARRAGVTVDRVYSVRSNFYRKAKAP